MNSISVFLLALLCAAAFAIWRLSVSMANLKKLSRSSAKREGGELFEFGKVPGVSVGDMFVLTPDDPFKKPIYVVVTRIAAGEDGRLYVRYAYSEEDGRHGDDSGLHGNSDRVDSFLRRFNFVKNVNGQV